VVASNTTSASASRSLIASGAGSVRRQVRQFPFRGVRAGEWRVSFGATPVLDKENDAFIRRTVLVPRSKATA
jgi:hypothetical protein